ncbi:hypothetical protein [Bartonella massiliensis]|uniref:hypothetical protein n=1 Tax=Bartonella massiliensis TaxID=929795 RepID=UPI0011580E5A|nr:hypothetical protein [Bartonella massiliensis]
MLSLRVLCTLRFSFKGWGLKGEMLGVFARCGGARCLRRVKHLLDAQVCRLGLEKKKGRAVF